MIAQIESAAVLGIQAYPVQIEVDIANGLPQLAVVGLPDPSVKEARDRVRSAIKNSGFPFPAQKITVNLAPADLKKEGPAFDLPIALGILAATGVIPLDKIKNYLFLGELALNGNLRPFRGAIAVTSSLRHYRSFVFPVQNAKEGSLEKEAIIYPAENLSDVVSFLRGEKKLQPMVFQGQISDVNYPEDSLDFADIKGQAFAKRAIEIAASGGHNLLLLGSPGAGKTMLAQRMPSILPPLDFNEALEITKIYSVAGLTNGEVLVRHRPFRAPHHTVSQVALVGGGSWPKPGEISLAHQGVLFLDEFPEFKRDVLESLRGPLEDGEITIARAKSHLTYPARFLLVAAMNPCPCGFLNDPSRPCRCNLGQIQRYQNKISGPILDRIDLHIEVPTLPYHTLMGESTTESSADIRKRVLACRKIQKDRFQGRPYGTNALMKTRDIKMFVTLDAKGRRLLEQAIKELRLSARAYFKILKIARTIADLAGHATVQSEDIAEAIQYRTLDRTWRG